jgi:hypothetical protein
MSRSRRDSDLCLRLSAAASSTQHARKLADFEWDIVRKAGYPIFSFAFYSIRVMFKYSVSGTEDRYGTLKYLTAASFWRIVTRQSSSHFDIRRTNRGRRIYGRAGHIAGVHLGFDYTIDASNATIDFCLRHLRSCRRIDESVINFTSNVTLAVDLTAGLISLGLRWSRCCGGSQCCDFSSISRSGLLLRRGLEIPPPSARIRIAVLC